MNTKSMLLISFSLGLIGCESTKYKEYSFLESVTNSAKDPMVWGNAVGAILLNLGDIDEKISTSARKHYYIFGSESNAAESSDLLRTSARVSMNISSLLVAEDNQGLTFETLGNKSLRFLTDNLNAGIVATTTGDLQIFTDFDRPNGSCCGFPSAHASRAFATANIAKRNYLASNLPTAAKYSMIAATQLAAYATAWARVESGAHYPYQVLAGAAYGTFLSSLIHDLTEIYSPPFAVGLNVSSKAWAINVEIPIKQ